jgi:hypothetical protein
VYEFLCWICVELRCCIEDKKREHPDGRNDMHVMEGRLPTSGRSEITASVIVSVPWSGRAEDHSEPGISLPAWVPYPMTMWTRTCCDNYLYCHLAPYYGAVTCNDMMMTCEMIGVHVAVNGWADARFRNQNEGRDGLSGLSRSRSIAGATQAPPLFSQALLVNRATGPATVSSLL